MTSHATVNLMLALEDEFDLEFPDELLRRDSSRASRRSRGRSAPISTGAARERTRLEAVVRATASATAAAVAREHAAERRPRRPLPAGGASTRCASCGALAALVPVALGGPELPLPDVAAACFELARACPATGMVFAMHQIQVGCLVAARAERATSSAATSRSWSATALLIASATSEVGVGGDLRSSIAARRARRRRDPAREGGPDVSYGAHADDFLITARRAPDAPASRPGARARPRRAGRRSSRTRGGTRSACAAPAAPASRIRAVGPAEQVLPVPFADIAVADDGAVLAHPVGARLARHRDRRLRPRRAPSCAPRREDARASCRRRATRLSELSTRAVSAARRSSTRRSPSIDRDARRRRLDGLATIGFALRINNLKIAASERVRRRSATARSRSAASPATRTTRRSASAATCATRCRRR